MESTPAYVYVQAGPKGRLATWNVVAARQIVTEHRSLRAAVDSAAEYAEEHGFSAVRVLRG